MTDILFVKLGALGDVINTLPLAVNLKKQMGAKIHWLVAPLSRPLVSVHPAVDRVILFDKKKGLSSLQEARKELKKKRFDLVLDLQRILKSGIFAMTAKGERRIGFDRKRCKEMTWLLPFERIPEGSPHAHMLTQYLEFGTYLGLKDQEIRWDIPVSGKRPEGLPERYIVLNIGATKPANRWRPERFAQLAKQIERSLGLPSFLTGSPEDRKMADTIWEMAGGCAVNLAGKTSIPELTELLAASSALVSCDTGPMHLGVALGKKVVALIGPSDSRRTGPYRGEVVQKKMACSPCDGKTCEDPKCMDAITPDDVIQALVRALDTP